MLHTRFSVFAGRQALFETRGPDFTPEEVKEGAYFLNAVGSGWLDDMALLHGVNCPNGAFTDRGRPRVLKLQFAVMRDGEPLLEIGEEFTLRRFRVEFVAGGPPVLVCRANPSADGIRSYFTVLGTPVETRTLLSQQGQKIWTGRSAPNQFDVSSLTLAVDLDGFAQLVEHLS